MKTTKQLKIFGRVQGVYFRESMCREAQHLGVTGWVRNNRDGTVEAVVQGTATEVAAIIKWAWGGPELAQVENIEISEASSEYADFARQDTV
ncbi:MAG: acylphosphatase [Betaproteobacteria bacterium]|nr:acylphosphatase [Betaproteobacteria bacterium]